VFSRKAALVIVGLSIVAGPLPATHAAGPEVDGLVPEVDGFVPRVVPELPSALGRQPQPAQPVLPVFDEQGTLRLAWLDPAEAAGRSAAGARDEASRLLRELGLRVRWRRARAAEPAREGEIRVILLDRAVQNEQRALVLGSTPARFDGPPFVWAHVPGVRQVLGVPAAPGSFAPGARDDYRLGVALGRVIAHEVVHALAPSVPHGEGLMKSRLTIADLTGSGRSVTPGLLARVRHALASPAAPQAPEIGLLAAEHAGGERQP
jgi:hypothetical protein